MLSVMHSVMLSIKAVLMNYQQILFDQLRDRQFVSIDSSYQFIPHMHFSHVYDVNRRYKLSSNQLIKWP